MVEGPIRTLIAGNWKMHGLKAQLKEIETIACSLRARPSDMDVMIAVPATLIVGAVHAADGLIAIGGEDCSAREAGPYTGDIDAEMLRDAGATSVILGHSERRRWHHETDAIVAAKAKAAWRHDLATIICFGETAAQRRDGDALKVCADQLAASLPAMRTGAHTSIAYEPLWAIGSGTVPTGDEIVEVLEHARAALEKRFGSAARSIRVLYGGSVKPNNASAILDLPYVDGVLVGGASLLAAHFNAILDDARGRMRTAGLE